MPATRLRGAVAAAAAALLLGLTGNAQAITIELEDVAPDRVERQRAAERGAIPLPGTPDVAQRDERLEELGLEAGEPVMLRIFKEESQLELWMERKGRFELFATYPICNWSGTLGPKLAEGDKQSPEGFYGVSRRQLHWSGRWPRSLNLGFPNAFDRSLLRTGSYLLVHGGCSSVGCYAMTNPVMEEIFGLVGAALKGGQPLVPVHVFPFRMTEENMARHASSEWAGFWRDLKQGYDSFERTRRPPVISTCNGRYYVRDSAPEPAVAEVASRGPLDVCGPTAASVQAQALLQSIVSHPSRWLTLSEPETALLQLIQDKADLARLAAARAQSSSYRVARGRGGGTRADAGDGVRVTCDLSRASCRKHIALKRQKAKSMAGSSRGKAGRRGLAAAGAGR